MPTRAAQLGYARALLGRGAPGDAARAERVLVTLLLAVRAAAPGPPPAPPACGGTDETPRYVFRREGDYWALAGGGAVTRVRGVRGFDYLAELLRHPHEQLYVLDLAGLGGGVAATVSSAEALEHGLRISAAPAFDAPLDHRARAAYRARWQELHAEAAAAVADNDPGRSARARAELEMLADALRAATRMPRGAATPQERARVNVRNCITAALRTIRRHDDGLWRHLVNTVKTGTFCVYAPDRLAQWEL
jgi:non-specific serine/threonine protein kinase